MGHQPSLPWTKINDFLLQVCSARQPGEFRELVTAHIADLIPHDFPILCFDVLHRSLHPKDPDDRTTERDVVPDHAVLAIAGETATVDEYNSHFRTQLPFKHGHFKAEPVTDFRDAENTEFVADFVRPRKVEIALCAWFQRYSIVIPRCKPARRFSDREQNILQVIAPHLSNFYDAISLPCDFKATGRKSDASRAGSSSQDNDVLLQPRHEYSTPEAGGRTLGPDVPTRRKSAWMRWKHGAPEARTADGRHEFTSELQENPQFFGDASVLTPREHEIAALVALGMSNNDIANELFISVETVKRHLYNAFGKLSVKNRVQLANKLHT